MSSAESVEVLGGVARLGDFVKHVRHGECEVAGIGDDGLVKLSLPDEGQEVTVRREELTVTRKASTDRLPFTDENLKKIPWERMRDELIYENGRWFKASGYFPLVMSARDARMMDFLINWQRTKGKGNRWFYCPTTVISRFGFIPPTSQPAVFKSLRDRKWITTKQAGKRGRRWIRINYVRLCRAMFKAYRDYADKYLREDENG